MRRESSGGLDREFFSPFPALISRHCGAWSQASIAFVKKLPLEARDPTVARSPFSSLSKACGKLASFCYVCRQKLLQI